MAKNNSKENNKKVLFAVIIVLLVVAAIYLFSKESVLFGPKKGGNAGRLADPHPNPLLPVPAEIDLGCGGSAGPFSLPGRVYMCTSDGSSDKMYMIIPVPNYKGLTQGPCGSEPPADFKAACEAAASAKDALERESCNFAAIDDCNAFGNNYLQIIDCEDYICSPGSSCAPHIEVSCKLKEPITFPGMPDAYEHVPNQPGQCYYRCAYRFPKIGSTSSMVASCSVCAPV